MRLLILASEPLSCMIELTGCVPVLHTHILKDLQWIRDQLNSTKEEVRELSALLYAVILTHSTNDGEFETAINYLISQTGNSKSLEAQHGALLAVGNCLEMKVMKKKNENKDLKSWNILKSSIQILGTLYEIEILSV